MAPVKAHKFLHYLQNLDFRAKNLVRARVAFLENYNLFIAFVLNIKVFVCKNVKLSIAAAEPGNLHSAFTRLWHDIKTI